MPTEPKRSPPSDHIEARIARFARFHDGKAGQQLFDPIGRAWTVGLLENDRVDPAVLRDAGRDYAARYWGYYPSAAGVANYQGENRKGASCGDGEDPRGERFQTMDRLLLNAGRVAYNAAQALCINPYWFPDDNPPWLERLINEHFLAARAPIAGEFSRAGDYGMMFAALDGLLALAAGQERRRAA